MRGGWARYQRALAGIGFDFGKSAGQGVGIAGPMGSGVVGAVFAGARDGKLNQHGCEWSEDDHGNGGDGAASARIFAFRSQTTKNHAPAGDRRKVSDGSG